MPEDLRPTFTPADDAVVDDVEADDLDDDGTEDDLDDAGTGDAADKPKPTAKKAAAAKAPKMDGDFDADRAQRLIERLRTEAKAEKAARQKADDDRASTLKKVAAALGLAEDEKPDPDKLAAQLDAAKAEERQRRTEMQVLRLCSNPDMDADADGLLDSTSFLKSIKDLDPADGSFREDIEDAIKSFVAKNARYRKTKASAADEAADKTTTKTEKKPAGRSGADMSGQGGKDRQVTAAELATMTPNEIVENRKKGLLRDLMGGA